MCRLSQGMKNGKECVCRVLEKSDIHTLTHTKKKKKSQILLDTIYHIRA